MIGGTGFISGTIVRCAIESGHSVSIVTRGRKPTSPGAVCAMKVDRKDERAFEACLDRNRRTWDAVIDCVCFDADDARQDVRLFHRRAHRLVFISTDFVYDRTAKRVPHDESGPFTSMPGYGFRKRAAELVLQDTSPAGLAWTIFRPGHVYGPGSLLGCLPRHSRDASLLERIAAGQSISLVNGGRYLQQPIFAADLAALILSSVTNSRSVGEIYDAPGADIILTRDYYDRIAWELGVQLSVGDIGEDEHLALKPEDAPFLCHRVYGNEKPRTHKLAVASTPFRDGLKVHVESLRSEKAISR